LENGRQLFRQDKTQEESARPQGRGDSLVAQLDSAVNQAEQFRDQQIQQQYSDQLGVTSKRRRNKSIGCKPLGQK
jgi:hypothetical protein